MTESKVLYRKMIKPSSPTPSSLRRHNLSFLDHINAPAYIPIATFYSKPENNVSCTSQISEILENSLSKVLDSYYPFAGRINVEKNYVDCIDIGVEYFNVQVNCPLSEILSQMPQNNDIATDLVFPKDLPWHSSLKGSPLVVQLSQFSCGGIAVSMCISHKIADGYSAGKFFNDWAAKARLLDFKPSPQFDAHSFFPFIMDDHPVSPDVYIGTQRYVSKMYHFSSTSLKILKNIVATISKIENPTRVEVATALIHKCGRAITMEINGGIFKPSRLFHIMNLRPPVPENTIGNACYVCTGNSATKEDEIQLPNLVAQLRMAKQNLKEYLKDNNMDCSNKLLTLSLKQSKGNEDISMFDIYVCSSFCNFGLYSIDFGWGTPTRVTLARPPINNHIIFLDDPSGDQGICALITLTEADMSLFQCNKEFQEFASPVV